MGTLNCNTEKIKITVGDRVPLNCSGNTISDFKFENAFFKLTDSEKYKIKIFNNISVGEGEIRFDITFYATNDHKISDFVLTDGIEEFNLNGPSVMVESVIKPNPDGKPVEPFGAIFPMNISIPNFYFVIFACLIVLMVIISILKIRKISYYKKLKDKINKYSSAIDSDVQFYKSIRFAEKQDFPLDQIENAFRLYNLRTYQLPMFDLSNQHIIKYFKHNFPQHKKIRNSLNKLLVEFEELHKKDKLLTFAEKHEFVKKLYRYVEMSLEGER